jgi:hypothetical protein
MDEPRDLITGAPLPDREDEPVRQAAEALLLELGYAKDQVLVDTTRCVNWEGGCLEVRADLLVFSQGQPALLLRCARGSLVSREREAVAASRLIAEAYVPLAAVYNGQEGSLLEVNTTQMLKGGARAIPNPAQLAELVAAREPHAPTPKELGQAARIYSAYSFISCPGQCSV